MKLHHGLLLAFLPCTMLAAGTHSARVAKKIVIVPIGDSITQGGRADRAEYTYRYPLFWKLKEAGYDVDFVGSLRSGLNPDAKWPDKNGVAFDPDHEGHYGWKTKAVRDKLAEWSASWTATPDVALIHLGTNDQDSKDLNADIVQPLRDMVTFLRGKNPHVAVLIGHLNFNGGRAVEIRPLVEAMAKEMGTKDSPVMTVATSEGWVENPDRPGTDTFDWAHPNEQGQAKMADKWLAAMKPLLGGLAPSRSAPKTVAASAQGSGPSWAFNPSRDKFAPTAFFDMRSMNEKVAGQSGFVTLDKNGAFVRGDGQRLRFWGVVSDNQKPVDPASTSEPRNLAHHARWLAKRGVNIARTLVDITPRTGEGWGSVNSDNPNDVNRKELDGVWRYVAAMKKEGIYSLVCPYWALTVKPPKGWGVDVPPEKDAHALLYFDPRMRELYKSWLRIMLTEKNPYTNIALKDDPALAILQLQNEDSLFFWTFDSLPPAQKRALGAQYGTWLKKKYGSLDAARNFWATGDKSSGGNAPAVEGDDLANGTFAMYPTWEFVQTPAGAPDGKSRRKADQMQFLATTMREFNADIAQFVRGLGAKCLINSTNWRPADTLRMGDAERWSYAANPVLAVNRYTGSVHEGKDQGWAIRAGDFYEPAWSQLKDPAGFPLTLKPAQGSPILITESSWTLPTLHRAEGSFLISAYGSLTGNGPYFFFINANDEWMQPSSANGYDKDTLVKWTNAQPDEIGQFPAAAWLARMGYVQEAKPVVLEQRSLEDLWTQRLPLIAEEAGFDPNRDAGSISPRSNVKTYVDPLAYFVGPVRTVYGGDPSKSYVHPKLSTLIDRRKQTVRSATGELMLDYRNGVSVLNAPKAQGVTGFLKAAGGKFSTRNLQITSGNEYASLLVVSLDRLPLNASKRVLVQVGTTLRPTGWQEKPATRKVGDRMLQGAEVVSIGTAPWQVRNTDIRLSIANPSLKRARLLDANMMPIKNVSVKRTGGKLQVVLPSNTLYLGLD